MDYLIYIMYVYEEGNIVSIVMMRETKSTSEILYLISQLSPVTARINHIQAKKQNIKLRALPLLCPSKITFTL